jgi:hypothetical protein
LGGENCLRNSELANPPIDGGATHHVWDDAGGAQNGLTLTKLEQSGLLSKAEELGVLSLTETLLTTDPGLITAASIPPLAAAAGTSTPTDSPSSTCDTNPRSHDAHSLLLTRARAESLEVSEQCSRTAEAQRQRAGRAQLRHDATRPNSAAAVVYDSKGPTRCE